MKRKLYLIKVQTKSTDSNAPIRKPDDAVPMKRLQF